MKPIELGQNLELLVAKLQGILGAPAERVVDSRVTFRPLTVEPFSGVPW